MASQPELGGNPMWVMEREMVTLRRNVEQELITGLRDKLRRMIVETFAEVTEGSDVTYAVKKRGKRRNTRPFSRQTSPTAQLSRQTSPTAVTTKQDVRPASRPDSPPVPQLREAARTGDAAAGGVLQVGSPLVSDATRVTDLSSDKEAVPLTLPGIAKAPEKAEVDLPNCVGGTLLPVQPDLPGAMQAVEDESESPFGSEEPHMPLKGDESEPDSPGSPSGPSGRRNSFTATMAGATDIARESLMTVLAQDEAIWQKKGALWALDPNVHVVARAVRNDYFDYAFGAVLILNSLFIGIRADWEASNLGKKPLLAFVWFERLFCVAFSTELGLRIYTFRLAYYLTEGWQWAVFDTVVVVFQILEEVVLIAAGDSDLNLGFLKMLKMGRLLRMVRMIRLLPELKSLVLLIIASMSAFLWTCFLLMLLVYMLAIYMVMMTVESLEQSIGQDYPLRGEVQQYWGSVGSAVLSCYWCITGGQDWAVVIGPLVEETGTQVHNIIFSMFVAFATMVLMNLVTGVFVEGAQRLTKADRDKDLKRMAHKIFRMVDDDCSDEISKIEFNRHMKAGNLDGYLKAVDLDRTAADNLFDILDGDGTDSIDVNEFIDGCLRLRGLPRSADVAQLLLETRKEARKNQAGLEAIRLAISENRHALRRLQTEVKNISYEMRSDSEDC